MVTRLSILLLATAFLAGCPNPRAGSSHPMEADPEQVDFGYVQSGLFSEATPITLTNGGTGTVQIEAILMAGEAPDAFDLQLTPPSYPHALAAGESTDISAYFAPPGSGEYLDWIEIHTSADNDGPFLVAVGGCSTTSDCTVTFVDPPSGDDDDAADDDDDASGDDDDDDATGTGDQAIDIDPVSMDFGEVPQNQAPLGDVLVISNVGGETLDVISVTIDGDPEFTIDDFVGGAIPAGGAPATVDVFFDPYGADMGAHSATITIESDDPDNGTLTVPLTAEVTEDCGACLPELAVDGAVPLSLEPFATGDLLYLQVSTGPVEISISNIGAGDLPVDPITEGGEFCTDHPAFNYEGGSPGSLAGGESATLEYSVGQAGVEVINFNGTYAFSIGTIAPDIGALIGHLTDGSSVNCSLGP